VGKSDFGNFKQGGVYFRDNFWAIKLKISGKGMKRCESEEINCLYEKNWVGLGVKRNLQRI
jgi:hypothetical protein